MTRRELKVERIEDVQGVESLKEDWNRLLQTSETRTVELTYEWQMTYWKHFSDHASLFVLVVREGDTIVAIAPLKLSHVPYAGLHIRRLEFIAADQSNYQDFILQETGEAVYRAILAYLRDVNKRWDVLKLSHVPEASATAQFLLHGQNGAFRQRIETQTCLVLDTKGSWEAYTAGSRSTRKKLARYLRRLGEALGAEVSLSEAADEEALRLNLNRFFDMHCAQWNQTETPSQFNDVRYRQFYLDVSTQLLRNRQVNLSILGTPHQPIALDYSFIYGDTYTGQLTTYDGDFQRFAPGLVMIELLVKRLFDDGRIKRLEMGDYYSYKEYWTQSRKNRLNFQVYAKHPRPTLIYLLIGLHDYLRGKLPQYPQLVARVKGFQQNAGS